MKNKDDDKLKKELEIRFNQFTPKLIRLKEVDRRAAILINIQEHNNELKVLMVKRASEPNDPWSGQIAYPGGRMERSDNDTLDTAIRETFEEVGLNVTKKEIIGKLSEVRTHVNNIVVTPYVSFKSETKKLELNSEVVNGLWVPIKTFNYKRFKKMKIFHDKDIVKTRTCYIFEEQIIWGLTRKISFELNKILGNQNDD